MPVLVVLQQKGRERTNSGVSVNAPGVSGLLKSEILLRVPVFGLVLSTVLKKLQELMMLKHIGSVARRPRLTFQRNQNFLRRVLLPLLLPKYPSQVQHRNIVSYQHSTTLSTKLLLGTHLLTLHQSSRLFSLTTCHLFLQLTLLPLLKLLL